MTERIPGMSSIEAGLMEIGQLFLLNLSGQRAKNRQEAVGVRFLGQKNGA